MIILIQLTGVTLLLLAAIHIGFPRYFKWSKELARISLINAEMLRIHTLFVATTVGLMGWLCVTSAEELVMTPFGKTVSLGLAIFWTLRLGVQFFGYSAILWRGKPFETTLHIGFIALWTWLSGLFWSLAIT